MGRDIIGRWVLVEKGRGGILAADCADFTDFF